MPAPTVPAPTAPAPTAPAPDPGAGISPSRRRWTVALVGGGAFLATLDVFIVNIAFARMHESFPDVAATRLSWVLSAYSVVFAALLVPAGRLADRLGRRTLFRLGLIVFAVGSALCAAAPSVDMLIAARAIQAVGGALMVPTSLGLLLAAYPRSMHRRIVSWWSAISTTAAACGPPLGGVLADIDWRWIFLINLPVTIPAILLGRKLPEDAHNPGSGLPDFLGAGLLIVGIGSIVAGLSMTRTLGWSSAGLWAIFAIGALGLVAFLVRCAHHPRPVVDLKLVRVPQFAAANATFFFFNAGFAGTLLAGPLFMQQIWGYSATLAGIAYIPGPIVATVVALVTARMTISRRVSAIIGCFCFAAASLWWALRLEADSAYLTSFLIGGVLVGAAVGFTMAATMGVGTAWVPPAQYATGTGILNTSRQVGTAISISIVVVVLGSASSATAFHHAYLLTGACALVAAVFASALREPPADAQM